ncbi:ras-interacting protein RIP3-like [Cotesia glomerata]|nr:ras-interacting protein RIP3-like [Cotesia glomerata]
MKEEEIVKLKRQNQKFRLKIAFHQQQQHQQQQQQHQQQQQQQQHDRYNPYYYLENDMFHVGDDIYIPSSESRNAFDGTEPSKFIKIMSHAIWGLEAISKLVVWKQKNTADREELDARKLELLSIHYRHFLKERNYSKGVIDLHLRAMNKYLDRAIQSSKKTVRRLQP